MLNRRELNKIALSSALITTVPGAVKSFAAGKPVRLPLHEFVKDDRLLKALRRGVDEMKKRKASDPLSWFYQAAIHGVTNQMVAEAAKDDPAVLDLDRGKLWNQCPHYGQNSANFLPWHRAYTHHFEEILRMHTGESDFAVPYWEYSRADQRDFPREFGISMLDGAFNKVPNPLFHAERDFFLCRYEHPHTDQVPLTTLSPRAVDDSRALGAPTFFGEDEASGLGGGVYDDNPDTRGILEQAPHDQIHRAVGGIVIGTDGEGNSTGSIGGMAIPMTAGFDPIFPIHHANIDRLWMVWSCMNGKTWGPLPDQEWFDEKPWFFHDTKGGIVNRSRKEYFDHRALGVQFAYEDMNCKPLELPDEIMKPQLVAASSPAMSSTRTETAVRIDQGHTVDPKQTTVVQLFADGAVEDGHALAFADAEKRSSASPGRVELRIHDIKANGLSSDGLDVYLIPRSAKTTGLTTSDPGYLGSVNLFVHSMKKSRAFDQMFDATDALSSTGVGMAQMQLVFVPYALTTAPKVEVESPVPFGSKPVTFGSVSVSIVEE